MELLLGWIVASFVLFGIVFISLLPVFIFIMLISGLSNLLTPKRRRDE